MDQHSAHIDHRGRLCALLIGDDAPPALALLESPRRRVRPVSPVCAQEEADLLREALARELDGGALGTTWAEVAAGLG